MPIFNIYSGRALVTHIFIYNARLSLLGWDCSFYRLKLKFQSIVYYINVFNAEREYDTLPLWHEKHRCERQQKGRKLYTLSDMLVHRNS